MLTQTAPNLLLVDDEALLALSTKLMLEKRGYRVLAAYSGEEAVATFTATPEIDLVLMDINLGPGIDGIAAAAQILETRNLPVVFLSSHTEREIVEKTEQVTSYGYVVKNSGITVLDASIKMAFKLFNANQKYRQELAGRKRMEDALEKRLLALSQPLDDPAGVSFEDLFKLEDIQRLQDEFSQATGVASIITRPDGTPITAPSNFCRLCIEIIRQTEAGRANCFRSDAEIGRACLEGPTIRPCLSGGLWDAGAGITVGGRHIANWLIGQVRDETQTEENMRSYARQIGAGEQAVVEAFREVPAMDLAQFGRVAQMLFTLANQLSLTAYQNVQQARFITERKRAEEKIQTLLHEKDLLLKEVHHRIKNNLTTIVNLFQLQMDTQSDPAVTRALQDTEARVKSMMVLYDKLYRLENFSALSVQEYFPSLLNQLIDIFPHHNSVCLRTQLDDILLPPRMLSPLGIILSELTTNAMKYAFQGRPAGAITVTARKTAEGIAITFEDDGIGLPDTFALEASTGFGMQLISLLVQQLRGALSFDRADGTKFTLHLPLT